MFNQKQGKPQRTTDAHQAVPALPAPPQARPLKFLAYGLPRANSDVARRVHSEDGFDLHNEPMGAGVAFQAYDGVVVFAGAFEELVPSPVGRVSQCVNTADLDQRERQFFTMVGQGHPFIFLLPFLPDPTALWSGGTTSDLFRRVTSKLDISWRSDSEPHPALQSAIPEFSEYIDKYGAGYVGMAPPRGNSSRIAVVCGTGKAVFGLVLSDKIFFLPCAHPQTHRQAVEMASASVAAAIAYRKRVSREIPEWVAEFAFNREKDMKVEAEGHRKQFESLETKVSAYQDFKAALCLQSDPLVEAIGKIMDHFFGLNLDIDDSRKVEDATLRGADGRILAVIEIKGINGNFDRKLVNQVDDHRERLGLSATVPGIAIVNTFRSAESLGGKDQPPNSEIIEKAVQDKVLLIRTLDLLRFADLVERGRKTKEDFRNILLNESGWLKADVDNVVVVKQ